MKYQLIAYDENTKLNTMYETRDLSLLAIRVVDYLNNGFNKLQISKIRIFQLGEKK